MKKSGITDLPLHYGRVPRWLAARMEKLGRAISEVIIYEYGISAFLTKLSDPFWFQSLGCVMGMDWHSSGITTSVLAALKRALNPLAGELGVYICGGRGNQSRKTPHEITEIALHNNLRGDELVKASRISAKVDNVCIQDGFQLYLHCFILSKDGEWVVIQQGMNPDRRLARRYHWHSESVDSFVLAPQKAIVGENQGKLINLSDAKADAAHDAIIDFVNHHPDKQIRELELLKVSTESGPREFGEHVDLFPCEQAELESDGDCKIACRNLRMPGHHEVRIQDINVKRLTASLTLAYESRCDRFEQLLMLKGIGPASMHALALVSEVIYGKPVRFNDPARFSFAHGGKDGHPFHVPLEVYDTTIETLRDAISKAKMGYSDKLSSIRKLNEFVRAIERKSRI